MKTAIGIDIGGTNIKAGLINENGVILKDVNEPTQAEDATKVLEQLASIVYSLRREDTIGVGIGSPGIVDPENNQVIEFGFNIDGWRGTVITKHLEEAWPEGIFKADNDANCAAIGEAWTGAGTELSSFMLITLGTGVGGAYFDKRYGIHHGHYKQAGEIGHMIYQPDGRTCTCGQKGCIEQYISATALKNEFVQRKNQPPTRTVFYESEKDPVAQEIIDEFIFDFSNYLTSLKHLFDPEAFVIGGGLIHDKKYWWDALEKKYRNSMSFVPRTKLLPAKHLNTAGMLGAAYLVFTEGEGHGTKSIID